VTVGIRHQATESALGRSAAWHRSALRIEEPVHVVIDEIAGLLRPLAWQAHRLCSGIPEVVYRTAGPEDGATVIVIVIPRLTGWSIETVRIIAIKQRVDIIVRTIRALPRLSPFG